MSDKMPVTKTAVVEDSITHQAGDGITANHAEATETPDIFDNSAQPAIKQVVETVPAETVALANAGKGVTPDDIATEGSTITTPSPNINPNGKAENITENVTNQPLAAAMPEATKTVAQAVVVEDSVTHQAGEGITAGMSPTMETPDIFDNSPQAAVKTVAKEVPVAQTANGTVVVTDDSGTLDDDTIESQPLLAATDTDLRQQQLEGENNLTENLQTLSDGTVDIPRD